MIFLLVGGSAAVISMILTPAIIWLARHWEVMDEPKEGRKIHRQSTPLLGGLAPFLSFGIVVLAIIFFAPQFFAPALPIKKIIGLLVSGLVLMIGGFLDDRYNLRPGRQIIFPILAALVVIASGIGIREVTNPWGGVISLVWWERILFWWQGIPYRLTLPADFFTFVWLLGLMYTTKFLDGLDGLVSGLTVIGLLVIFLLTMTHLWYQPSVGLLALMAAGAFLGFLFFNFHPAKIFLGEGGSLWAGFLLGGLAIISGGKIATTLLILGVPVLDAAWVILRRVLWEKKSPIRADTKHLHFRLLEAGFSSRQAVIIFYILAAFFGTLTLILQSQEKLAALGFLSGLMIMGGGLLVLVSKYRHHQNPTSL